MLCLTVAFPGENGRPFAESALRDAPRSIWRDIRACDRDRVALVVGRSRTYSKPLPNSGSERGAKQSGGG